MSDTLAVTVENKGRVVVPADLRQRHSWVEGTTLVAIDNAHGVLLVEQSELEHVLRERLAGLDPLGDLLGERRAASAADDLSSR